MPSKEQVVTVIRKIIAIASHGRCILENSCPNMHDCNTCRAEALYAELEKMGVIKE